MLARLCTSGALTAKKTKIAADLDIAQTEMKAGLQATYDAMMDAQFAGDQKAYNERTKHILFLTRVF